MFKVFGEEINRRDFFERFNQDILRSFFGEENNGLNDLIRGIEEPLLRDLGVGIGRNKETENFTCHSTPHCCVTAYLGAKILIAAGLVEKFSKEELFQFLIASLFHDYQMIVNRENHEIWGDITIEALKDRNIDIEHINKAGEIAALHASARDSDLEEMIGVCQGNEKWEDDGFKTGVMGGILRVADFLDCTYERVLPKKHRPNAGERQQREDAWQTCIRMVELYKDEEGAIHCRLYVRRRLEDLGHFEAVIEELDKKHITPVHRALEKYNNDLVRACELLQKAGIRIIPDTLDEREDDRLRDSWLLMCFYHKIRAERALRAYLREYYMIEDFYIKKFKDNVKKKKSKGWHDYWLLDRCIEETREDISVIENMQMHDMLEIIDENEDKELYDLLRRAAYYSEAVVLGRNIGDPTASSDGEPGDARYFIELCEKIVKLTRGQVPEQEIPLTPLRKHKTLLFPLSCLAHDADCGFRHSCAMRCGEFAGAEERDVLGKRVCFYPVWGERININLGNEDREIKIKPFKLGYWGLVDRDLVENIINKEIPGVRPAKREELCVLFSKQNKDETFTGSCVYRREREGDAIRDIHKHVILPNKKSIGFSKRGAIMRYRNPFWYMTREDGRFKAAQCFVRIDRYGCVLTELDQEANRASLFLVIDNET